MPINPNFSSLYDLKAESPNDILGIRKLFGMKESFSPDVDKSLFKNIEAGILHGTYKDDEIADFARRNPEAAPFLTQAIHKRNIYRQNFQPGIAPDPLTAGELRGSQLGAQVFDPNAQLSPEDKGRLSLAEQGRKPVDNIEGAVNALRSAGMLEEANKLIAGRGQGGRYQGPILFDTQGRTYRATREGTIAPVNVEGGATIAPPIYPFTSIDPVTGQPVQNVISRPEAARRGSGGVSGLGASAPLKPLPKDASDALGAAPSIYRSLDMMEKTVKAGKTGRAQGVLSKAGAFFGTDQEAIEHETARTNFQVQAQAIIKGIPSNFDVQTITKTFSDLLAPGSVNQSRINYSRQAMDDLLRANISYHMGQGYAIPEWTLELAKQRGINPDSLKPWDGKTVLIKKGNRFVWGDPTENKQPQKQKPSSQSDLTPDEQRELDLLRRKQR